MQKKFNRVKTPSECLKFLLDADTLITLSGYSYCLIWRFSVSNGYPIIKMDSRPKTVASILVETLDGVNNGRRGKIKCLCGNKNCVNPYHWMGAGEAIGNYK